MLLSSVAETMFWGGRYIERAQALARAIRAVEGLSLDLPGRTPLGLGPLLPLLGKESPHHAEDLTASIGALALNVHDASSVLGALRAARENLREARVVAPPELWIALNNQYQLLSGVAHQPLPRVLDVLSEVLEIGSRIQGVFESSMTRDEAYAFMRMGFELERADMQVRVFGALLPALSRNGWERAFDDVRWAGLLSALGVHAGYRRRHHYQAELGTLLDFLVVETSSPRSVLHCLRVIEEQLCALPRTTRVRSAISNATSRAFELSRSSYEDLGAHLDAELAALASVYAAIESSYFPEGPVKQPDGSASPGEHEPFEILPADVPGPRAP